MFLQMKWYGTLFANNQNNVRGVPRVEVVQKESRWRESNLHQNDGFMKQ
jgi:hypothetical protein